LDTNIFLWPVECKHARSWNNVCGYNAVQPSILHGFTFCPAHSTQHCTG